MHYNVVLGYVFSKLYRFLIRTKSRFLNFVITSNIKDEAEMKNLRFAVIAVIAFLLFNSLPAPAQGAAEITYGKGFRTEQDGWIYVHIEGSAKKRGEQLGYLLAPEIDEYFKLLKAKIEGEKNEHSWDDYRKAAGDFIIPKVEKEREYRDELKGIITGLTKTGISGYDFTDIVVLNAGMEIDTYFDSLPESSGKQRNLVFHGLAKKMESTRCSAFIATGSVTKSGKIVLAHNTWDAYILSQRGNIILDIKPGRGARILMQGGAPGYIHSGTDFAITSYGLMISETTIAGVKGFDTSGIPEFIRMRKATQYSKSIDAFYTTMFTGNNGGYPCSWLIGDIKTNEIAKIEIAYNNVAFYRSMDGYYDGQNYVDDSKMIREVNDGHFRWDVSDGYWPFKFKCENSSSSRRMRWFSMLDANKGLIDAEKAKEFLSDQIDPLTGVHTPGPKAIMSRGEIYEPSPAPEGACDGMVATSEMTKDMNLWGRFDHTDGTTFTWDEFLDTHAEFAWQKPYLRPLKDNPWTTFSITPKK